MNSDALRIWSSPPAGAELRPESDLVLHAPIAGLLGLPEGALADDLLESRPALDDECNAALARWRSETEDSLTVEGLSLGRLFEGELYPDVFLRERQAIAGLESALERTGARRVDLVGADRDLATALAALLGPRSVEVAVVEEGPSPSYPIAFASAIGPRRPVLARARELAGAPALARSGVLLLPGPVIEPLWSGLRRRGVRPVLDLANPPRVPAAELARRAAAGGWVGHPGRRERASGLAAVETALGRLELPDTPGDDPIAWLESRRAAALLRTRAPEVIAGFLALRRSFGRGLDGAVVPSDGTALGRATIVAAADAGATVTHVQHGFFSDLWHRGDAPAPYVDGLTAPRAATWSEQQRALLAPHAAGRIEATGNPAAAPLATDAPAPPPEGPLLVLVQAPPIGTPAIDRRAPARYVRAALEGIASARPGARVVLRPHPLDPSDYTAAYEGPVETVASGPIDPLLARAGVCVGPLSTGTLTAAAMGLPTVHLDVTGASFPEPFGDSGGLPRATTGEELAAALAQVRPGDGAPAALEALGARPDATERVLDLVLAPS